MLGAAAVSLARAARAGRRRGSCSPRWSIDAGARPLTALGRQLAKPGTTVETGRGSTSFRRADRGAGRGDPRPAGRRGPRPRCYLVLYAADAADGVLERSGTEALRTRAAARARRPGCTRSAGGAAPQRLRTLLTLGAARSTTWAAWVALDVHGRRAGHAHPGPATGAGRRGRPRALVFDRARHSRPEVVIVAASDDTTNGDAS